MKSYCAVPGCPNYAVAHRNKCPGHLKTQAKDYDRTRESAALRGYDRTWAKVRYAHLQAQPLCARCGGLATMVHHVVPLTQGGARLDHNNLLSLCNPCHLEVHQKEL